MSPSICHLSTLIGRISEPHSRAMHMCVVTVDRDDLSSLTAESSGNHKQKCRYADEELSVHVQESSGSAKH